MNDAERQLFCRLSVFRGGFTREAAQAVAGASLGALTRLAHKSLVRRGEGGRYEFHDLLRQFAAEQLKVSGERAGIQARHSDYYLSFVAQRERRLSRNQPTRAQVSRRASRGLKM